MLITLALLLFFRKEDISVNTSKNISLFLSFVFVGIAYLIRPDSIVLVVYMIIVQLVRFLKYRKMERYALTGMSICVLIIASLHIFQYCYYNDFWPNTFYLKITGGARSNAFFYLLRMTPDSLFIMFAIIFINTIITRAYKWVEISFVPVVYIVYIFITGGDVFGFSRYFVSIIPFVCIFSSVALDGIVSKIRLRIGKTKNSIFVVFATVLILSSLMKFNLFFVNIARNGQAAQDQLLIAESLEGTLKRDELIAVAWAGSLPYFMPDYRFLDVHGKNDKHIARTIAHPGPPVGHNKWDLDYVLEDKRPAAIVAGGYVPYDEHPTFTKYYQPNWVAVPGTKEVTGFWLRVPR